MDYILRYHHLIRHKGLNNEYHSQLVDQSVLEERDCLEPERTCLVGIQQLHRDTGLLQRSEGFQVQHSRKKKAAGPPCSRPHHDCRRLVSTLQPFSA